VDSFSESPTLAPRVVEGDDWLSLPEDIKVAALPAGISVVMGKYPVKIVKGDHTQAALVDELSRMAQAKGAHTLVLSRPHHRMLEMTLSGETDRTFPYRPYSGEQHYCYAAFLTGT